MDLNNVDRAIGKDSSGVLVIYRIRGLEVFIRSGLFSSMQSKKFELNSSVL